MMRKKVLKQNGFMSKRERHERDTWIHAGCPPKGNKKCLKYILIRKKTNWHEKSISCKRRNQIVVKNLIVISCSLISEKSNCSKKSNYKAI